MFSRATRTAPENADAVGLVVALLVRFPEIATIASHPGTGSIVLSFVVRGRLDRRERDLLREAISEHVRALLEMGGEQAGAPSVSCEAEGGMTFVRIARDARTFSREELAMMTAFFSDRFGEALIKSPMQDESADEDPVAVEELVDSAIEVLRDPSRQKSLVGFREEKRVLVYFLKPRKKAKAAVR
jgi:hypothetical protein